MLKEPTTRNEQTKQTILLNGFSQKQRVQILKGYA